MSRHYLLLFLVACGSVSTKPDAPPAAVTLTVATTGSGTLTVVSDVGSISCGASCTASIPFGTAVTLTPMTAGMTAFAGWVGGGCTGTGACTIQMTADATVTATSCDRTQATFDPTGTIDPFTVPAGCGHVTIDAFGAQGGGGVLGGKGAEIRGTVSVRSGEMLHVLVGKAGQGSVPGGAFYGFGGGGGSFVTRADSTPLVIAGGGGGADYSDTASGMPGEITTAGDSVQGASGGVDGTGGQMGTPNTGGCGFRGSGGGGLLTDGGLSANGGGIALANGGAGGPDPMGDGADCVTEGPGGFGGGGAGGNGGGGGGGYSGGAGGSNGGAPVAYTGGGGGGSFNAGTDMLQTAGVRMGDGTVLIIPLP